MNKLYYRAWLKEEKKLLPVVAIHWNINNTIGTITLLENFKCIEVPSNRAVIMQGVRINDKIIYIGDIVNIHHIEGITEEKILVEDLFKLSLIERQLYDYEDIEVLGNIYENKELMK